jgi:8-oxo-dGTP diphosphatase
MNDGSGNPVRVAVGIIMRDGKILCCQRKKTARYGLQWEFPGGKIDEHETADDCLKRELREELSIVVGTIEQFCVRTQTYPDNGIFEVHYYLVKTYGGDVKNNMFESIRWLRPNEFHTVPFLEGNKPVLEILRKEFSG